MTVNVLGTRYTIKRVDYGKDPELVKRDWSGYCNEARKLIVIMNISTAPGWEDEPPEIIAAQERECLRHELIHAFLNESGLSASALPAETAWSKNEEMVDWFAIQWPKIAKAFRETGCAE